MRGRREREREREMGIQREEVRDRQREIQKKSQILRRLTLLKFNMLARSPIFIQL